jgi:HD superfamily phosphohydrolase
MKKIRDNIHGDIEISPLANKIISNALFQRLRYIAQNGLMYLVYPGARHSRFEHSIGVYHISNRFFERFLNINLHVYEENLKHAGNVDIASTIKALKHIQKESQRKRWGEIFSTAALLHDIGHGPYSHTFEVTGLIKNLKFDLDKIQDSITKQYLKLAKKIEHEQIGLVFCDKILQETDLVHDVSFVSALIDKDFKQGNGETEEDELVVKILKPFISGLIDCDRLDYVLRDSKMSGVPYGNIELDRLVENLQPVLIKDGTILRGGMTINSKYSPTVDHFIFNLFQLYPHLYYHPAAIRLECELVDIVNASTVMKKNITVDWYQRAGDRDLLSAMERELAEFMEERFARVKKDIGEEFSSLTFQILDASEGLREQFKEWTELTKNPKRKILKDDAELLLLKFGPAGPVVGNWKDSSSLNLKYSFEPTVWRKDALFVERLKGLVDKLPKVA